MEDVYEDPLAVLALRLRTLKAQRGLQMGGLQQRTGLGRTTLSQTMNGQAVPSEATLVALAKALGADVGPMLALREAAAHMPRARKGSPIEVARRRPVRPKTEPSFKERYLSYVAERHSKLTVVGLDLSRPERARWPLDAAYLSLELAERLEDWPGREEANRLSVVVNRAEHALANCRRVLLRGLAGSGKTTLLQWLAVATARDELPEQLADWQSRIPFVLPLRTLKAVP
ncbi:helix-turn-helix domain-containing protein [Streptomyces alboflavus]|uniref:helix-turn-helix domain-containing protein n=1 Tax=Streptomyces alboflavus TaxID=67267 RepID=UPI001F024B0D|nr:helix-turn-helix domain-containing protein [Streptomyces alboflavus]